MKYIVVFIALIALIQLGHSRSLRPVYGLQMWASLGKYAFDKIENATLKMAVHSDMNGIKVEHTFPFDADALYPGSTHFQLFENATDYSFENVTYLSVYFELNGSPAKAMATEPVITMHDIHTITHNHTSGQYINKYYYPEDFQQKIRENERMQLKASNSN